MYRKICLLLFLNFQTLNLFMKLTIMLCIMFLMMLMIVYHHPFIQLEHNYLEYYSSISSLFLIFATFLYVSEISDSVKAFCFLFISITNFLFVLSWGCGLLKILTFKYSRFFLKYIPSFVVLIITVNSTLWFIIKKNCVNPFRIVRNFKYHYRINESVKKIQNNQKNQRIEFQNEMNCSRYNKQMNHIMDFMEY